MRRRLALVVGLAVVVAAALSALLLAGVGDDRRSTPSPSLSRAFPSRATGARASRPSLADFESFEPFSFAPGQADDFRRRGARASAHVLYTKSPGGAEATAARVDRWSQEIARATARRRVSQETLGALVFLESAGRSDAISGGDPEGAVGLAQLRPDTAVALLGLSVDLARSKRLTRRIERERHRALGGRTAKRRRRAARRAERLDALRRRIDERFDPQDALDGAARYLSVARRHFGREDLAAAAYHAGMANLDSLIDAYVGKRRKASSTRKTVRRYGISYPRLFFDSSPTRHRPAYRRLRSLGDDSRTYLFRLDAAREIRRLHAEDPARLRRLSALHAAKASAEEVLRPESRYPPYEDGDALRSAYENRELVRLPNEPARLGFRLDPRMGALARRLDESPALYGGLRAEALACLLYVAKEVRQAAGGGALRVTSTVRDTNYQRLLLASNAEATSGFSLHTTGFALDIARSFRRPRQQRALAQVLERLRALAVIDWVYEPGAIHLTAGPDAKRFLPLYEGLIAERA